MEIETWCQWTTNRKWPIGIRMVTWPMTSRDPERSRSWPEYAYSYAYLYSSSEPNESGIVNRQSGGEKLKYILKFYIKGTCHVISRMHNDDLALCLWAHDVWGTISRNPLELETWVQWTTNKNGPLGFEWSRDRWRYVTQKGQGRDLNMLNAKYLENGRR